MITHHLSETPTKFTFVPLHTLNTGTQDLQERNYFPHRRANTPGAEQVIWYENKPTHCRYCSVTQSCPTLCNPMDCSIPGFPVLHCLPEFAHQTHVHRVGDAIQPSHPLSPSSFAFNLSQHQVFPMTWLFTSGGMHAWRAVKATSTGHHELWASCLLDVTLVESTFLLIYPSLAAVRKINSSFVFLREINHQKGEP